VEYFLLTAVDDVTVTGLGKTESSEGELLLTQQTVGFPVTKQEKLRQSLVGIILMVNHDYGCGQFTLYLCHRHVLNVRKFENRPVGSLH